MGALMRRTDWAATPVGPVSRWPRSLRLAVQIILNSRYPMFVWWGRELIYFYNDAHVPILGNRHPQALGQSAPRVWAEVWDEVGPQADAVLNEGRPSWNEDRLLIVERKGYREEAFFTFSYGPVPNDEGGIGGIISAHSEETQRVIGQRRLKALQELAARTTTEVNSEEQACESVTRLLTEHALDVPFALIYLLEENGRAARLAGATGIAPGSPAAPVRVELDGATEPTWSLRAVMESGRAVVESDLDRRFGALPGAAWPEPTQTAVVLPISTAAQGALAGLLVAGVSPRRELDDPYRAFFDLLASHIGAAIIRGRASDEARRRAESLAELDRTKTAFFSNVSHEFRTPLTLMLGPLSDALAEVEDPNQRERLEVAYRNTLRLRKLVNSILDFSRIEAGRMEACYQATDLGRLTTDLASGFRSACETAGVELVIDCPAGGEPVFVDRDMWERIVLNLVSNAFKFTFAGRIGVSLRTVDDHVELKVQDTGIGIAAEHLPRLFERFHRVEGAAGRTQEGSGIGLATVRELSRLHGGDVVVESRPGDGSTFTVTASLGRSHLPTDRVGAPREKTSTALGSAPYVQEALRWLPTVSSAAAPRPTAADASSPRPGAGTGQIAPIRVLLADDNGDMRDYLVRLLGARYSVEAVADGEAALRAARAKPPDLVLADVMMPRLDGFGLLRALRAEARTRWIPVVLVSARAGEEARIEGLDAGADDYLVKPFGAHELLARVGGVLALAAERKRAAEALHRSEERYRRYFSLGLIGMAVTSPTGRCVEVNDQLCQMLRYSRDELLQMNWAELTHPRDRAADRVQYERVARGEIDGFSLDKRWIRKDGEIVDSTIAIRCMRTASGSVDHFVAMVQDITERKRAETALRQSEKNLSAELASMVRLQEVSTRLVRAGDGTALLQEILDAAIAITGADMGNIQLFERDSGALRLVASRGFDRPFLEFFDRVHEGGAASVQSLERVVVEDVSKSPIFVGSPSLDAVAAAGVRAVQFTPLVSRAGRPMGMLSTHYRTVRRPAERDLRVVDMLARQAADWIERNQAEEALREADRAKSDFLAALSHELRNPLAPIKNGLSILERAPPGSEMAHRAQGVIGRQLSQLTRLVDDLLDVTRISRNKLQLQRERLELRELVSRTVEDYRPQFDANDIRLELEVTPGPLFVDADRNRLAQALGNLLQNAAKFAGRGGMTRVTVTSEHDSGGARAILRVADDGAGVPPELLPRLFHPFVQADQSLARSKGGLGLGLALVKAIIEHHGGEVSARSEGVGRGMEVVLRLPLSHPSEATSQGQPMRPPPGRRRVLIIEDNPDFASSLRDLLALFWSECEVAIAKTGQDGLRLARTFHPEIVLCDIGLPEVDGYQIARAFREDSELCSARLAALSGYARPEDLQQAAAAGFEWQLAKPLSLEKLDEILRSLDVA
jgi:PAS domain S-box-containing protein